MRLRKGPRFRFYARPKKAFEFRRFYFAFIEQVLDGEWLVSGRLRWGFEFTANVGMARQAWLNVDVGTNARERTL